MYGQPMRFAICCSWKRRLITVVNRGTRQEALSAVDRDLLTAYHRRATVARGRG